ncbi:hypothetical protein PRIPAC_91593 [Pristionchus pacificus]|uniref:Uncharacterized protein n=1 Tax=Pristionchus pacificus TaxID=54126 RepID=A0A2A6BPS3_PRIPA|nr:hypothetical protein PRIPAC_91593 [Pristionchus pacificus]|eukprot:PDM67952.1 hypothetical protein PRIPAC_45996 [Pristionchus pacificus]
MLSLLRSISNKLERFWKWIACHWLKITNRQGISIAEERGERVETQPSARINSDTSHEVALESHERQQRQERWEESLRILGHERDQIINEYSSLSLRSNEERDAELSRIAEESRRAEELFEEKLMEARDSIARVFEEHRRMRREMLARLFEMWRNEEWSRQSEAHLCSRLNLLRNAHEPVRRRFMNLSLCLLDQAQGGSSGSRVSHLQVMGELTLLKDELRGEITTMNDEVVDMQEFKMKYPQAGFLTDIEKSKPDETISVTVLNDCQQCFEELERQVEDIPTVLSLKERYQNSI